MGVMFMHKDTCVVIVVPEARAAEFEARGHKRLVGDAATNEAHARRKRPRASKER